MSKQELTLPLHERARMRRVLLENKISPNGMSDTEILKAYNKLKAESHNEEPKAEPELKFIEPEPEPTPAQKNNVDMRLMQALELLKSIHEPEPTLSESRVIELIQDNMPSYVTITLTTKQIEAVQLKRLELLNWAHGEIMESPSIDQLSKIFARLKKELVQVQNINLIESI